MNYSSYRLEDFLTDESFIKWVKYPDVASDQFWQQWLMENPEKKEMLMQAADIISSLRFHPDLPPESVLAKMEAAIHHRIEHKQKEKVRSIRPALAGHWYAIAATFSAILLATAFFLYQQYFAATTRYSTDFGETKSFRLPDNSVVILNANSSVLYIRNAGTGDREVWLKGEAFFQVNRQKQADSQMRRFIVHTADMDVVVLGTQFNVNNRRAGTQVVLHSGKVQLALTPGKAAAPQQIVMQPGELVCYATAKKSITHKKVNPADYISWKENKLIFKHKPLYEIARILEENYNYQIVIENDALKEKMYEGVFPADDIEVLLQTLSKSVTLEADGKNIIIKEKK